MPSHGCARFQPPPVSVLLIARLRTKAFFGPTAAGRHTVPSRYACIASGFPMTPTCQADGRASVGADCLPCVDVRGKGGVMGTSGFAGRPNTHFLANLLPISIALARLRQTPYRNLAPRGWLAGFSHASPEIGRFRSYTGAELERVAHEVRTRRTSSGTHHVIPMEAAGHRHCTGSREPSSSQCLKYLSRALQ